MQKDALQQTEWRSKPARRVAGVLLAALTILSAAAITVPPAAAVTLTDSGRGEAEGLPIVDVQYRYGPPPPDYYYDGPPRRYYGPPRDYYGPPRWRHGYRYPRRPPPPHWYRPPPPPPPPYYYRSHGPDFYNPGAAVAAGVLGLAAGAALDGALAAQDDPPPRSDATWLSYCASKYRSFDPDSGTYVAYDGKRYFCK